jgi:hypothetical protein
VVAGYRYDVGRVYSVIDIGELDDGLPQEQLQHHEDQRAGHFCQDKPSQPTTDPAEPAASARCIHRPRRELGGSRAPSFPVPRCMHYRPPGRSAHRIVPQQLETTLEG